MANTPEKENNVVLAPNEFAYILDSTNGQIKCLVGPYKTSLGDTDYPVIFREDNKRFEKIDLSRAIQIFAIAPEGWYIILKNPSEEHPTPAKPNNLPSLNMGRKINIPGPNSFALWPGQMKKVVQGHHLHSNQYLLVRIYDEEEARKNWGKAIIKPVVDPSGGDKKGDKKEEEKTSEPTTQTQSLVQNLVIGKLLVIKGTDVAFYIPPTGVEVVATEDKKYVREAITLETLEYCILLDENGKKEYVQGPAVVFPEPTQTFIQSNGKKVFKAYELNEISGLYLKVISEYVEDGKEYKVGEELFITGKEQAIYYPREEHAIIKYGDQEIHHGIAIPAGEGRYSLDRLSGAIPLVKGPCVFLPDPRKEVIIRRILDLNTVDLWYPGNQEAKDYNTLLMSMLQETKGVTATKESYVDQATFLSNYSRSASLQAPGLVADQLKRKMSYTPPRTITLDTKYEGVPIVKVWTGYAVLMTSKTGKREVVIGPTPILMQYDETLEYMELSTGTPKTDSSLHKTVYLRVLNNKVSDIIQAETKDLCPVKIQLSYRVNFEGDKEKWFNVENYVKFLTEHLRSLIRNIIKQCTIENFYSNSISIIRDCVLGKSDGTSRPGRAFDENGMRVYEVEVLNVEISNAAIQRLLTDAQAASVVNTINLAKSRNNLEFTTENERIRRQISDETHKTFIKDIQISIDSIKQKLAERIESIKSTYQADIQNLTDELEKAKLRAVVEEQNISILEAKSTYDLDVYKANQALEVERLQAESAEEIKKITAISTDLIKALQSFSDKDTLEKVTKAMAPLTILGGKSVVDIVNQFLKGTFLENILAEKESEDE